MTLSSSLVWGGKNGFLFQIIPEKIRMQRVAIGGTGQAFGTYATNGVSYDLMLKYGFTANDTSVVLDPSATYSYVFDKANKKIIFLVTATGAELTATTDISAVVIYGTLIGK